MRDYLESTPIDSEWVLDYPLLQNYVYKWEYGAFYLNQRPNYCDQGKRNLICDNWGLAEKRIPFASQYFMDLTIAKLEVHQWIKTIRHFTQNPQEQEPREWAEPVTFTNKNLTLHISIAQAKGSRLVKVEATSLTNPPTLDKQDGFPRYYLCKAIAFEETRNWLKHRELIANNSLTS